MRIKTVTWTFQVPTYRHSYMGVMISPWLRPWAPRDDHAMRHPVADVSRARGIMDSEESDGAAGP